MTFDREDVYQIVQNIVLYELLTFYIFYMIKIVVNRYIITNKLEDTSWEHLPKILRNILMQLSQMGIRTAILIALLIAFLLIFDHFA